MTPALLARVRLEQARCTVNPLRGCELCDYSTQAAPAAMPALHTCTFTGRPVHCATARAAGGHCGPEACHQRIGGDDLAPHHHPFSHLRHVTAHAVP